MPPKTTTTQEQILQAAFEIARAEGLEAVSARRVARELDCSTQPVYRAYGSMDELKQAVLLRILAVAQSYLSTPVEGEPPFLQFGLGNLRFAEEEPNLFQALSLSGPVLENIKNGRPPPDFVLERMRADPQLATLTDEQLTRIHDQLWFFSQGLTSLFLTGSEVGPATRSIAQNYLRMAGMAVIGFELFRSKL